MRRAKGRRRAFALVGVGAVLVVMFAPVPVDATAINVKFVAVVDYVSDLFCQCIPPGAVSPGDTLLGSYTFDSGTVDSDTSSSTGLYDHATAPYGIIVEHQDYTWETDPLNVNFRITVADDESSGGGIRDRYAVASYSNRPDAFTNQPVAVIYINLIDGTGTAVSSDGLPSAINLADWQVTQSLHVWGFDWELGATIVSIATQPTSVGGATPGVFALRAHPNPFTSSVSVSFTSTERSRVTLEVFDVRGRRVRELLSNAAVAPGSHVFEWDGRDRNGKGVVSGVYFCALRSGGTHELRKLLLLR